MSLTLRRMADRAEPHLYEVLFEGWHVGRINLANPHDQSGINWCWGINWFERSRETAHHPHQWDCYSDAAKPR